MATTCITPAIVAAGTVARKRHLCKGIPRSQSRLTGKAFPVKTYAQNNIFNLAISLIYFAIKMRR
jgi:hypothetical protein